MKIRVSYIARKRIQFQKAILHIRMQVEMLNIVWVMWDTECKIRNGKLTLDTFRKLTHLLFREIKVHQLLKIHLQIDMPCNSLQVLYPQECTNKLKLQLRIYPHQYFRIGKIT